MSTAKLAPQNSVIHTSDLVAEEATSFLRKLEGSKELTISVTVDGHDSQEIGPALVSAIKQALAIISQGGKVNVQAQPKDLTTTNAAQALGISRPTLMKLIREEQIPAHKVGSHFRLLPEDVEKFRAQMLKDKAIQQREAFEKLLELESNLPVI